MTVGTPERFVEILEACQATTKKAPKLAALSKADEAAKLLMREALSGFTVYGVKKFNDPPTYAMQDASAQIYLDLLARLDANILTGNAARDAVQLTLSKYTQKTASFLKLIISKDLKAGFSAETLNKIYPNLVPIFNVALAEKVDEDYEYIFPLLAEVKYDGERTISTSHPRQKPLDDKDFNPKHLYSLNTSRNGKAARHLDNLFDDELAAIAKVFGKPIIIDSEVLGLGFTETQNAKSSTNDAAKKSLALHAFDFMPLEDWENQDCKWTQLQRRAILKDLLEQAGCKKIILSEGVICNNYAEVRDYYDNVIKFNPKGKNEGLIIKNPDGLYVWDRSPNWAKKKPVYDCDLTIVGFLPGRKGARLENTLGKIICEGKDENGKSIKVNVGGGFSDVMRNEIWTNQQKYLGKTVQVEFQEMSKKASDDVWSLRFPVFVKVRDDK